MVPRSPMAQWTVRADYDANDGVWYVVESDIPGLAVDGETIADLGAKAGAHLPDLLDIHRYDLCAANSPVRTASASSPSTNALSRARPDG